MTLAQRLEQKQGQGLVLAPCLLQAIGLLQLSHLELDAYVQGELERNPLLQREDAAGDGEDAVEEPAPFGEAEDEAPFHDWPEDFGRWAGAGGSVLAEALEPRLTRPRTLREHLEEQAGLAGFDVAERAIAAALVDAVDEAGYLRADLAELCGRLGCRLGAVEQVLERLQGFEPAGVFARDVRECLALQLRDRGGQHPAMTALIGRLDLLARGDIAALKRACGVDHETLMGLIAQVRGLKPRPGAAFGGEPAAPVAPDAIVREAGDGLWRVELNSEALPRLLVDYRYHAEVSAGARTQTEKAFLSDSLEHAHWVTRSLDQRARTVLMVAAEIVRRQDEFLAYGVDRLRPMTLKTVADAIGMHESTVSRASANKYLATPRGVYEMKFFFTSAVAARDGERALSVRSVQRRIQRMVQDEAQDTLSDDRIVEMLKTSGVDVARRTVAKHREALRIPSSAHRRRRQLADGA